MWFYGITFISKSDVLALLLLLLRILVSLLKSLTLVISTLLVLVWLDEEGSTVTFLNNLTLKGYEYHHRLFTFVFNVFSEIGSHLPRHILI